MLSLERTRSTQLVDAVWRVVLRLGFRLARIWWHIRRPHHEGALVAIYVGRALLLVKPSYRSEWGFPGGSLDPGETPDAAARREMQEELGFSVDALSPAGTVRGTWDGRIDHVHFFELHLDCLPALRLDNREIVAARLAFPEELAGMALTGAVAAFIRSSR
jgi:8-oxo-dGTP diphosphatase